MPDLVAPTHATVPLNLPRLAALGGVVAIGGGTGLGRTLRALSGLGGRLTGVVATTDNGGSTGWIRQQAGGIAWGDIRNCLSQVVEQPTLGSRLLEYRFVDAGELSGHSLGNLIMLALDQLCGRPLQAIDLVREVLGLKLHLLPMCESPAHLAACYADARAVHGQIELEAMTEVPPRIWLEPLAAATPEALQAVLEAELILFGPGSFMTSILPALLLPDFRAAVAASRAPRVLIASLHPESGPVGLLDPAALLHWTRALLGVQVFDLVLWPASRPVPNLDGVPVLVAPLAGSDPRVHEPALLAQAIERCLGG